MRRTFNLGTFLGIRFRLHFSWFIIFILVTVLLVYPDYRQWYYWLIGIITSLVFFTSVVAHELAHSLVGRANGIPIGSITLFIFGGIAEMTEEPRRPGAELKMAAAGPFCSLTIGSLFGFMWLLIPNLAEPVAVMILWLAVINGALAAFNLIPGFPLDGGRILRSILWHFTGDYYRSTRIATRLGQAVGCLFILGGIVMVFLRPFGLSWFEGLWIAFIGWFVLSNASASYRQLLWQQITPMFTVGDSKSADSPTVPPDIAVN